MPRGGEHRVGETLLRVILEQRRGHPQRLETPDEPSDLPTVSLPPRVFRCGAGATIEVQNRLHQMCESVVEHPDQETAIWIGKADFRPMRFPPLRVPPVSRRNAAA